MILERMKPEGTGNKQNYLKAENQNTKKLRVSKNGPRVNTTRGQLRDLVRSCGGSAAAAGRVDGSPVDWQPYQDDTPGHSTNTRNEKRNSHNYDRGIPPLDR